MLHAVAMKPASRARCAEMVLVGQGKATVSGFASERSGNLRKIVASNGEFALNLQWIRLFYGHLIRVYRPCPSVVELRFQSPENSTLPRSTRPAGKIFFPVTFSDSQFTSDGAP